MLIASEDDLVPIQPAYFDVPPIIQAGIDSGALVRFGGVVRDNKGHIFKHLDEVPITPEAQEAVVRKMLAGVKNHKGVVFLGISTLGATVGGVTYVLTRKRRAVQQAVEQYDASLQAYLEALRSGALDAERVIRLISDLDAVRALAEKGAITVDLTTEPSATLVDMVVDYTSRLAEANNTDIEDLRDLERGDGPATVLYLRRHLEAQREIFSDAA